VRIEGEVRIGGGVGVGVGDDLGGLRIEGNR